ncbi:hypothetical protein JQC92_10555 [Shewanella sp. 202IG2-18]|uniref:hypothetical protein n=1 Tax=Parashewanella hymeniacidonis TaxID=2807618 RepID=UPI00196035EE|nr:hypothetical protein [Parashewanella hymeniacidonis]MBM7072468.1 hypothetical protein [Parashewanella hymeniacidonis]
MAGVTPKTDPEFCTMYEVCEQNVLARDAPSKNPKAQEFRDKGMLRVDSLMFHKHFSYGDKEYSVRLEQVNFVKEGHAQVTFVKEGTTAKGHTYSFAIKQNLDRGAEADSEESKRVEKKLEMVFNATALDRLQHFTPEGKKKLPADIYQAIVR